MISVVRNGMGIALLDAVANSGKLERSERTELLDRVRAAFPDMKIAALTGDCAFIADTWMA